MHCSERVAGKPRKAVAGVNNLRFTFRAKVLLSTMLNLLIKYYVVNCCLFVY